MHWGGGAPTAIRPCSGSPASSDHARRCCFAGWSAPPGEKAQVDFSTGAWIVQANGKRKRPHLFRIALSHSRKAYSEVVYRQTTEAFIRCIEKAFCYFGGMPKTLVVDNLKAAVIKADWCRLVSTRI